MTQPIVFDNSYINLPERFYTRHLPTTVVAPALIRVNKELSSELGIDANWLESQEGVSVIAGNTIIQGSDPLAAVYAGHQFGSWNPQLGDGRAILLGEVISTKGARFDIQLKGSGPTPYSRGGDGRAPLGPILREYIVSEAMAALGVPTTRALAAVTTGEKVIRQEQLPGGVLARVASSHIRIGTFEFFSNRRDKEALEILLDHVISRHYPDVLQADNPRASMLFLFIERQAKLVAQWQSLGFIHGVMNTDNILLSGETIDYGPCAFIDEFQPDKVFSSIDHGGRYAYSNQPGIMVWNLARFAESILPLLCEDQDKALLIAREAIDSFAQLFQQAWLEAMGSKLQIIRPQNDDEELIQQLLSLMTSEHMDFTLTFRYLSAMAHATKATSTDVSNDFELPDFKLSDAFEPWLERWKQRLSCGKPQELDQSRVMSTVNPIFIPRNHLIEESIVAAVDEQNFQPFNTLVDLLANPYEFDSEYAGHALPPRPDQIVYKTFCGT